jgi:hypothetical protein
MPALLMLHAAAQQHDGRGAENLMRYRGAVGFQGTSSDRTGPGPLALLRMALNH